MRSELLLVVLATGCAFGQMPGPTTAEGVVTNLLSDRLIDGAELLTPVGDAASVRVQGGAVLFQEWPLEGGYEASIGLPDGDALSLVPLTGATGLNSPVLRMVGGVAVLWSCGTGEVWLARPGDDAATRASAPTTCPAALGEGQGGELLTGEFTGEQFEIRTFAIEGDALRELSAETWPSLLVDQGFPTVHLVSDEGLVASGYVDLVRAGPGGTFALPDVGSPRVAALDGDAVLLAFDDAPEELRRWVPSTGADELVGRADVDATSWPDAGTVEAALATRMEAWGPVSSWVTAAWWLTPTPLGYEALSLPPHPCHDDTAALDVGLWSPTGVLDTPGGRMGLWSVTSWLGPAAVVIAPLP